MIERVQYLDEDGRLITESLKDYTRKAVRKSYASLDDFLTAWNDAERKQAILEELGSQGVFLDELADQVGRDYDAFDLVCHVAFDQPPLTRRERAAKVKKRDVFAKYGDKARAVLEALLDKYADGGISSVESLEILKVDPLTDFGTPVEIVKLFGGKHQLPRRHPRTRNRPLPGSCLNDAQRLQPRQNHPGHHAQGRRNLRRRPAPRTARLDVLSENLRRSRKGTRTLAATTTSSPLPQDLRWSRMGADEEGITGDALLDFVNNTLLPKLKTLTGGDGHEHGLIRMAFEDANNYMKNGTLMRQVINKINGIDFNASDDRHMFGDIYEKLLKDLQSAGNAGEFYTPRAVTQFIVDQVNPRLGETILDPACGTGGFLVCAIEHLRKQAKTEVRRTHHPDVLLRHRKKTPAAHPLHDQSHAARHRRARQRPP